MVAIEVVPLMRALPEACSEPSLRRGRLQRGTLNTPPGQRTAPAPRPVSTGLRPDLPLRQAIPQGSPARSPLAPDGACYQRAEQRVVFGAASIFLRAGQKPEQCSEHLAAGFTPVGRALAFGSGGAEPQSLELDPVDGGFDGEGFVADGMEEGDAAGVEGDAAVGVGARGAVFEVALDRGADRR